MPLAGTWWKDWKVSWTGQGILTVRHTGTQHHLVWVSVTRFPTKMLRSTSLSPSWTSTAAPGVAPHLFKCRKEHKDVDGSKQGWRQKGGEEGGWGG